MALMMLMVVGDVTRNNLCLLLLVLVVHRERRFLAFLLKYQRCINLVAMASIVVLERTEESSMGRGAMAQVMVMK